MSSQSTVPVQGITALNDVFVCANSVCRAADDMPGDFSSPSGANNHRSSPLALAGSDQPAELMDATGTAALKQPKMDQSE